MAKRRRDPKSDGTTPSSVEYNRVFVDTSLDTHLVMLLSDSDTVLDFKKKIMQDHAQCFPKIGEIWIHSLKVKRKGNFYHLPDFMLVWSAFDGVKGSWFLSADASGSLECYINQKSPEHGTSDHFRGLSSDANEIPPLKMSIPDGVTEENIVSEMTAGRKVEKSSDKTTKFWINNSVENSLETGSPVKKKLKMRYNDDLWHSPTLEDNFTQFHAAGKDSVQPVLVCCRVDAGGEAPDNMPGYGKRRKLPLSEATAEVSGVRYDQSNMEHSDVIGGTSVPAPAEKSTIGNIETSANFLGLHDRKEDTVLNDVMPDTPMAEKPQYELGQIVPTTHLDGDILNTSALKKKRNSKRRKDQLLHDQVANPKPSSPEYGKGRSFFSDSADFPGNVALSEPSGVPEKNQCEPLSIEVRKSAASCPLKGTGIKEPYTGHLELKIDNANQFFELKVKGKASSMNNGLPIIDGKDKETHQPDIDEAQRESFLNPDPVLMQSEKLGTLVRHEAHGNTRVSVQPDDNLGAHGEMEHGNRSKRKAKKCGGKIRDKTVGQHTVNAMHLAPAPVPNLELNTLKHHETEKADSILPTAETDLNAGSEDRDLSVNHQSDFNQCEVGVTIKEANSSARLIDANGAVEDAKFNGNNRKKRRAQKAVANIQDMPNVELKTNKGESIGPYTKTNKSKKTDEERELILNHDLEVMLPSYNKTSACSDPVITPKEVGSSSTSELLDANFLEEPEISRGSRKKKRVKKSADTNLDKSDMVHSGQETDQPDIDEEQRETSLNQDPVPIQSENLGTLDWHEADGNIRESVQPEPFSCTKGETERGIRNKKRAKKSRGKIHDETVVEHSDNGVDLTPSAVPNLDLNVLTNHETKRTDAILPTFDTDLAVGSKEDRNLLVNHEPDMNQPDEGVTIKEPRLSAGLMHATVASEDANYNGDKRKKKKAQKDAGKIQDTSDLKHEAWKGEGVRPYTEICKSKKKDEERGLSLNHDCEVMLPPSSNASGCADPELKLKEGGFTSKLLDGDMIVEPEISRGRRRKKRVNNSADANLDKSDMEHTNHGTSDCSAVLLFLQTDNFPEETEKGESISFHKGKDAQINLLDGSAADAKKKVIGADGNKLDFVKLTQTMEDVGNSKKKMDKKNQSSASDCHTVLPAKEKENQVENLEPNQAQNNSENVLNKDKKAKKKTKRQLVASDVQENLPVRDQEVGVEVFATQENVSNFLNSEQDRRHVDSSQVLSHRSEETLEDFQETAAHTDDLAWENKDEGINFKNYFVHVKKQDEVASDDAVKKVTKSNEVMNSGKKVKKHGLPSVSTSTELHNSLKSYESKDGKTKSRARCASSRNDGESAVNSDWNEVIPNPTTRSLEVSGNGVKNSGPSETRGRSTSQKHNETPAAYPFVKEKNLSLDKSSSERSGTFPENGGNKRWQSDLNASNKIAMKTPQKSSLLTKIGAIFGDSSGESSGDENGPAYSDASTCSPSDSSSLSGCSVGESDLSQASTRNGSNDGNGRFTGGKNISKLDLSASKEITMDMILRSSKRFKKAKLIASQNEIEQTESQAMESVPDSQPNP